MILTSSTSSSGRLPWPLSHFLWRGLQTTITLGLCVNLKSELQTKAMSEYVPTLHLGSPSSYSNHHCQLCVHNSPARWWGAVRQRSMIHVGRWAQRGKLDHQVHRASRNTASNLASPASSLDHRIILSFLFHLDFGRDSIVYYSFKVDHNAVVLSRVWVKELMTRMIKSL